jgi:hypothetical protein
VEDISLLEAAGNIAVGLAVPEHVRNDTHVLYPILNLLPDSPIFFESWATKYIKSVEEVSYYAPDPVYPELSYDTTVSSGGLAPTASFWDTNPTAKNVSMPSISVSVGLAEYANANFFSDDTINMGADAAEGDYPYPNRASTSLDTLLQGLVEPMTVTAEDGKEDRVFYVSKIADGEEVAT